MNKQTSVGLSTTIPYGRSCLHVVSRVCGILHPGLKWPSHSICEPTNTWFSSSLSCCPYSVILENVHSFSQVFPFLRVLLGPVSIHSFYCPWARSLTPRASTTIFHDPLTLVSSTSSSRFRLLRLYSLSAGHPTVSFSPGVQSLRQSSSFILDFPRPSLFQRLFSLPLGRPSHLYLFPSPEFPPWCKPSFCPCTQLPPWTAGS